MLKGLEPDYLVLSDATNDELSQVEHHLVIDCTSNVGSTEAANGLGKRLTSTSA